MDADELFLVGVLRRIKGGTECAELLPHRLIPCPSKNILRHRIKQADLALRIDRNNAILCLVHNTAQEIRCQFVLPPHPRDERRLAERLIDCLPPRVDCRCPHAALAGNTRRYGISDDHIHAFRRTCTQFFLRIPRPVHLDFHDLKGKQFRQLGTTIDHVRESRDTDLLLRRHRARRSDGAQDIRQ